jgi:ABC-2 type transport system permease protein
LSPERRALLIKDLKVFLRDTSQWSQLLLLLALALVYVYNFRVLDLDRIPYMSRLLKNAYAFVNLAMAAFVMSAIAVRFVFPAVSSEGRAFWMVRSSPVRMSSFLWSKFWVGFLPILLLAEALTLVSNRMLGVAAELRAGALVAIALLTLALVALACGMGARYPRFGAESLTHVAGSYGGVAFMVVAVLFIVVNVALLAWPASTYLWHEYRGLPIPPRSRVFLALPLVGSTLLCLVTFWTSMRRGVRALEELG